MSALTIYSDTDTRAPLWHSTDARDIAEKLNARGVRFERWEADRDLGRDPAPETVINAYQHAIDKLVAEKGYQSWDVISLRADNPQKEALRAKFLNEHTHGKMKCVSLSRVPGCFVCTSKTRCTRCCARKMTSSPYPPARRTGLIWVPNPTSPRSAFSIIRKDGLRSSREVRSRMAIRDWLKRFAGRRER